MLARPVLTTDLVVFSVSDGALYVLLLPRPHDPFSGRWALPGVAVEGDETLIEAARRALNERVGVSESLLGAMHLEQLAAFDGLSRDPRERSVSVAHLGVVRADAGSVGRGRWHRVGADAARGLPFDHDDILATGVERLRGKLRYTALASYLIAEPFVVDALRAIYEVVLEQKLNRSNFRTRLERIGLLECVGVAEAPNGGGRPPNLYRFARDVDDGPMRDFV